MPTVSATIPAPCRQGTLRAQSNYLVEASAGVYYIIFSPDTNDDLYWTKSTDGGYEWSLPNAIYAGVVETYGIWFEKWTPGDSGTIIHIAWVGSGDDDCTYDSLNTSNDAETGNIDVFAGLSTGGGDDICVSITKTRGGNLLVVFTFGDGAEGGLYRSTALGASASFTIRADPTETAAADYFLIFPGFAADNQDALILYWDRSAEEVTVKVYDDSADSIAESAAETGLTDIAVSTCCPQWAATIDFVNSTIVLLVWTNRDTLNADLRCYTVVEAGFTAKTNVVTDSTDDQQCCAIAIDTNTADWYAFYFGKSDGSETAGSAVSCYYKVSTDDGTTWGSETSIGLNTADYNLMNACQRYYTTIAANKPYPLFIGINGNVTETVFLPIDVTTGTASGAKWWGN